MKAMTHMTVTFTLGQGNDSTVLKRILRSMKGVLCTNVTIHDDSATEKTERTTAWIEKMRNLSNGVDSSVIDLDDDRTRYLMSK